MLASGILLAERLYLGIEILDAKGETDSEYQNANDGYFKFKLLQGRDLGVSIDLSGRTAKFSGSYDGKIVEFKRLGSTPDQRPSGTQAPGWRTAHNLGGNYYTLTITDNATGISANCTVILTWSDGSVVYNGSTYGIGTTIMFDYADLR
jgi:hypothetical protein